jgi:2-keto-4-pentenoate hydratase/2-oxohepta-3-ene-1,7-dioic acid hydratase in catechol pathway
MTIYCIGRNYAEHARELNNPVPTEPIIFSKPATAALRENKAFYLPDFSQNVHYEVEVLLKVGKPGRRISEDKALEHISHIGLGIDFTARDIQDRCKAKGHPWEIAKAFDHSAVIGDWISREELPAGSIRFSLLKNKQTVQQGDTDDLIFPFERLISVISGYFTLMLGDIIFTGTPEGVGQVHEGDLLEGYIGERRMFWTEVR